MTVVSFVDYTPPPRFDVADPWTAAKVYEAAAEAGPYTLIDTVAVTSMVPATLDTDPKVPATRSFTTQLGTLEAGWYYVQWRDASGDQASPTQPRQNGGGVQPSVDEVAQFLRTRTVGQSTTTVGLGLGGDQPGDFSGDTRPTDVEVAQMIQIATDRVFGDVARDPIATVLYPDIRGLIILFAAMAIEVSYFKASAVDVEWYQTNYDNGIERLQQKIDSGVVVDPGSGPVDTIAGWVMV